jgi:hypothetical protein
MMPNGSIAGAIRQRNPGLPATPRSGAWQRDRISLPSRGRGNRAVEPVLACGTAAVKKEDTVTRKTWSFVGTLALLTGVGLAITSLQGCSEEDCLSWGENCTQQYLQNNYGRTDIYCCEGQCLDHGSGILTCGS